MFFSEPKIKGESTSVGSDFKELIPKPLTDLDKTGFHMHVTEILKMNKRGFLPWEEWEWKRAIIENYCKRTGVNYQKLMQYVTGKYWTHIQHHLIKLKMI